VQCAIDSANDDALRGCDEHERFRRAASERGGEGVGSVRPGRRRRVGACVGSDARRRRSASSCVAGRPLDQISNMQRVRAAGQLPSSPAIERSEMMRASIQGPPAHRG
jgi:hypothetical protein